MENENKQDFSTDYNFKRLSLPGEKTWDDVIKRFINEMVKRGGKTSREDMEWLMLNYYALPNSPALKTAGKKNFYASACSSYPIYDTLYNHHFSIMDTFVISSLVTKAGVGTGFNFSQLRGMEESVSDLGRATGGPNSFLRGYSGFGREIMQSNRRKASMGLLDVNHPDIFEYVIAKDPKNPINEGIREDKILPDFNLSIILRDDFLKAVEENKLYILKYRNSNETKEIKALELFNLIADKIWEWGDPGVFFGENITNDYFEDLSIDKILANPCSEAILSYGEEWLELCVLLSINLVKYHTLSTKDKKRVVDISVRLLNDIIDVQDYVLEYQRIGMQEINRKIGIGICGLATVLALKGIKFSSEENYDFTKGLFAEIGTFAIESSSKLGNIKNLGRYNTSLLSVAPTSTLANIFNYVNPEGCSYGGEPYFSKKEMTVRNSYGEFKVKEKILNFVNPDIIETANDLTYKEHLIPVRAYYDSNPKGIVQGFSKTINFKTNVSVADIKDAIFYCWKNKIKAISFYRDGSKSNQVISDGIREIIPGERPVVLPCDIHHVTAKGMNWIVLVGINDGRPWEVFAFKKNGIQIPSTKTKGKITKVKSGVYKLETEDGYIFGDICSLFEKAEEEVITRNVSLELSCGISLRKILKVFDKSEGTVVSFSKAIARTLKKYLTEEEKRGQKCPECGADLIYSEGCLKCSECTYNVCG